jgi:hypothetical protein
LSARLSFVFGRAVLLRPLPPAGALLAADAQSNLRPVPTLQMHFQSMLAALAVLAAVALAEIATELTGDNFESSISGKNALVMFKAPW